MYPNINNLQFIQNNNFFLIAGPCAVENEKTVMDTAETLFNITQELKIPFIFKSSYRKANRSKGNSFTGIGDDAALNILNKVKTTFNIPITTDIHAANEAAIAAQVADVLQIPAFLCRQTDILEAAALTQKVVSIKKGQFLSPQAMKFALDKIHDAGNQNTFLIERGTMLGYQDLVVDFRGIPQMQAFNVPVVLDCTHSLQQPNQNSGVTGGLPELIETIAKAGIAVGVDGLFIETHPNPKEAKSDGANMLPLNQIKKLLIKLLRIYSAIK